MSTPPSETTWENLPDDPDLNRDLNYGLIHLDVIDLDTGDQVVVLPHDQEMLHENAFLIVDVANVCDLGEWA